MATYSCGEVIWRIGRKHSERTPFSHFEITFPSSFAVALMNTSPEEQVVDVPFEDIFRDLVCGLPPSPICLSSMLICPLKGKEWREATYTVYDLWEKDQKGEWGRCLGAMSGGIQGATVATHYTKVWKLVPTTQHLQKRGRRAHRGLS